MYLNYILLIFCEKTLSSLSITSKVNPLIKMWARMWSSIASPANRAFVKRALNIAWKQFLLQLWVFIEFCASMFVLGVQKVGAFYSAIFIETSWFADRSVNLEKSPQRSAKKKLLVVGVSGKIGSGKNYICENVIAPLFRAEGRPVVMCAFADMLKLLCAVQDSVPYEKLFHEKDANSRALLQTRGDSYRASDPDFFFKLFNFQARLFAERGFEVILVPDVRFANEFKGLRDSFENVALIRVDAPKRSRAKVVQEWSKTNEGPAPTSEHRSETELDSLTIPFDLFVFNDFDNEVLAREQVAFFCKKLLG